MKVHTTGAINLDCGLAEIPVHDKISTRKGFVNSNLRCNLELADCLRGLSARIGEFMTERVTPSVDPSLDLFQEIDRLRREMNAVILAHYYQEPEIQDIADHIGDSLALAQLAAETDCGGLCG